MRAPGIPLIAAMALVLGTPNVNAEPDKTPSQRNITYADPDEIRQIDQLYEKASELVKKKDYRGVIHLYQEIIFIEPDDEAAYTNLGHAYMVLGDTAKAKDAFLNALDINPENKVARLGIQKIMDPDSQLPDP